MCFEGQENAMYVIIKLIKSHCLMWHSYIQIREISSLCSYCQMDAKKEQ